MSETKTCNMCGLLKPALEFYRDSSRRDGRLYRCIPCHKTYAKSPKTLATRRAHGRTIAARRASFAWALGKRGIDLDQWNAMLIAQSGRCGSCSDPMTKPHVDHSHATGRVRGLLCHGCNTAEGLLRGDPARALALADYMTRHAA